MKVLGIVKVFEQLGIGIGIYCIISYKLRLFSATPYFGYTPTENISEAIRQLTYSVLIVPFRLFTKHRIQTNSLQFAHNAHTYLNNTYLGTITFISLSLSLSP